MLPKTEIGGAISSISSLTTMVKRENGFCPLFQSDNTLQLESDDFSLERVLNLILSLPEKTISDTKPQYFSQLGKSECFGHCSPFVCVGQVFWPLYSKFVSFTCRGVLGKYIFHFLIT